jgi:formylglycine-generating enzyme
MTKPASGARGYVIAAFVVCAGCGDNLPGKVPPDAPMVERCLHLCGPAQDEDCCESLLVPGGTFFRGYDLATDWFNDTSNPATISDFRLDRYEVTVGRFRAFVYAGLGHRGNPPESGSGAHPNLPGSGWDAEWSRYLGAADTQDLIRLLACDPVFATWTDLPGAHENRPINCVTWYEAMAFCIWDGGYLPTAAEWNYAASGGDEHRAYPWSDPPGSRTVEFRHASYWVDETRECFGDLEAGCTIDDVLPVGSKPDGNARWGHADMAGNIEEWNLDWFGFWSGYLNPCHDCARLEQDSFNPLRVSRGGAFRFRVHYMRASSQSYSRPGYRADWQGFRCARPAE